MGRLLFINDATKNANWYFSSTYFDSSRGHNSGWDFPWPNIEFPVNVAIHADEMGENKRVIRRWIEHADVGTVIYEYKRNSYRVYWSQDKSWDRTVEIQNNWEVFYFEDSESALAFSLRFSDLVRPMTDDHPTRHHGERYKL